MLKNTHKLMQQITHGVYVISVDNGQQQNAFTAAWLMQVSFKPLLLCFSINPNHRSYSILQHSGKCCISVLNNHQLSEASHFGQSTTTDKMKSYQWISTASNANALADCRAYFDCRVDHFCNAGDHTLIICEVINGAVLNTNKPMLYSDTNDMDGSSQLYKIEPNSKMTETRKHQNDPLHGLSLKVIVTELVEKIGWNGLADQLHLNCFSNNPSINSSLKFLRKTPWARNKVEQLYLKIKHSQ